MIVGAFSEKVRTFIAIFPPDSVKSALQTAQAHLGNLVAPDAIRLTRIEQIHLTLQFLGPVERERLSILKSAIQTIANDHTAFRLTVESLGCFPSLKRPRVLWAGLAGELALLKTLKVELDAALSVFSYEPEKREFHPHFTIGRVAHLKQKESQRLGKEISKLDSTSFGECNVQEIHLMQSVLSREGATYRTLKSFPLKTT